MRWKLEGDEDIVNIQIQGLTPETHLWLLLAEMTREIADRILRVRIEERENSTVAAPGF
jgi:hypothetical protein